MEEKLPWCQCGKNINGFGYDRFIVGKFTIPNREDKVCWDCMLEYVCSVSYEVCACLCHGQPFNRIEVLQTCEHCNGQVERELKRLRDLRAFYPQVGNKPFDTDAWKGKKIIYTPDEEEVKEN